MNIYCPAMYLIYERNRDNEHRIVNVNAGIWFPYHELELSRARTPRRRLGRKGYPLRLVVRCGPPASISQRSSTVRH